MKGINLTRVLIAGLAAGVVINLGEFILWAVVLEEQFLGMMAANGLTEASWAMPAYVIGAFVLGITLAFTYAAIRPRFGPGWRTAAIAGGILWVAGWLMPAVWVGAMGISFGTGTVVLSLAWGLAEVVLAGVAAGWAYQEERVTAGAAAGF